MFMKLPVSALALGGLLAGLSPSAHAASEVLNLYTARHYQTDEALYDGFTKATGIKVNRIEGKEDELFERIQREGAASPADVFLTVDAARLHLADEAGIFSKVDSKALQARIPAQFRADNQHWFGFSYRARVIAFNPEKIKPDQVDSYADLAAPELKGKVCVRSGGHVYNRTLMASVIAHQGEDKALAWAEGIVNNLARAPKGGDTDQIRAVAAGECDVAISNHYYYARLMASTKPEDQAVVAKVSLSFPDQQGQGTHVNISGGGVVKHAPNREAAVKFLEYLASDEAQAYFANGNNEWPVVQSVKLNNAQLERLGSFKVDTLDVGRMAQATPTAQRLIDKAGWK